MEGNYLMPDRSEINHTQANNDTTFIYSVLEYSFTTSTAISRTKKILQIQVFNSKLV